MSIQFKRSSVAGLIPAIADLKQGELALNLPDKKIFTLDNNNEVINVGFSKDEADITYLRLDGGTMTGPIHGYSTSATQDTELVPKKYVDISIANSANATTASIAAWKTWLPISGGTMTGRLILNGLTPVYDYEAVTKKYVNDTFFKNTGGTINGIIELYDSTPYIDFHHNNSTTDFTHRIIASDANTLQLSALYVETSANFKTNGSITTTGNISATGTIIGYGDINATGFVYASTVRANKIISTGGITAAQGAPIGDGNTAGYSFASNGDSGIFYEGASTNYAGGSLVLRNDSVNALHINSAISLNINTYYKGTLLENLVSSAKGLRAVSSVNLYSGTVTGAFTLTVPTWIFGGVTPSYVMYSIRVWNSGYTDVRNYYVCYDGSADWNKFILGASSDDTDQGGTASIAGASTCLLPYAYNQQFFVGCGIGNYNGNTAPNIRFDVIGYQ